MTILEHVKAPQGASDALPRRIRVVRKELRVVGPDLTELKDWAKGKISFDPFEQDLMCLIRVDGHCRDANVIATGYTQMLITWAHHDSGDEYYASVDLGTSWQPNVGCVVSDSSKSFEDLMLAYGRDQWQGDGIEPQVLRYLQV